MRKKVQYLTVSLISLMLCAVSCEEIKYEDDEAPEILEFSLSKDEVTLGDTLYMSYIFEDDKNLTSYKVYISPNFERTDTTTSPLDRLLVVGSFTPGKSNVAKASVIDTIIIPETTVFKDEKRTNPVTAGEYTLEVRCVDWVGRQDTAQIKTLKINPLPEDSTALRK